MQQFELNFEGGLTDRFPDWMDCIRASVHGCGRPLKAIAADLDMSPSELSRRLAENPNDTAHFWAKHLPALLASTRDLMPVYWLVEKFCQDSEARKRQAIHELTQLLPRLHDVLRAAGVES